MDALTQGLELYNAGRFEEARARFQAALDAGERDPELRCFLAHALDSLNRPQEALRTLAALIADHPRHVPAYAAHANLMLHRGPFDHQRGILMDILTMTPPDAAARLPFVSVVKVCAQALRASGDLEGAEKALRLILTLAPEETEPRGQLIGLMRMRAHAQMEARDLSGAEKSLRDALAEAPGDEESRRELADVLRRRVHENLSPRALARTREAEKLMSRAKTQNRLSAERTLRAAMALQPSDEKTRHRLIELLRQNARALLSAGRTDAAEGALRRALAVAPKDNDVRRALLGLWRSRAKASLEAGRGAAAERLLRRALAFEPKDLESRRRLEELLRARVEASVDSRPSAFGDALESALALANGDGELRRRIAELLRTRGFDALLALRLPRAELLFRAVLRCDPRDSSAWISLAAVERARGRPSREKSLLRRALAADEGRLPPAERFKALARLGRYALALEAAERILDGKPGLQDIRAFWDPWEWDERAPRADHLRELRVLERSLGRSSQSPWLHFYRGVLLGPAGLAHFSKLASYPAKRYGWMFHKAGAMALAAAEFETAADWLRRSLASRPADWRARGFLAEARLCLGRTKAAFAEMDRARREAPPEDLGDVLAWRGELDLWLGRYERALVSLEKAEALGARGAYGWKGAALLKLGRRKEALAQLDRTLALNPLDFEALVWRGEAKRELGRHREALRDLERVPAPISLWARINGVLSRSALGDGKGADADFESLPSAFLDALRAKTGLGERDALMKAALKLGLGFRRDEYRQAIWLR